MFLYIEKKEDIKNYTADLNSVLVHRILKQRVSGLVLSWGRRCYSTACTKRGRATDRFKESDLVRDSSHHSLSVIVYRSFCLYCIS